MVPSSAAFRDAGVSFPLLNPSVLRCQFGVSVFRVLPFKPHFLCAVLSAKISREDPRLPGDPVRLAAWHRLYLLLMLTVPIRSSVWELVLEPLSTFC